MAENNISTTQDTTSADSLVNLVRTTMFEQFYDLAKKEGIGCFEPVIVKTIASDGNSAKVSFPTDPTVESSYYYPNRTGTILTTGAKVYLQHKIDDQSQGWLIGNNYLTPNQVTKGVITSAYTIHAASNAKECGKIGHVHLDIYNSAGFAYNTQFELARISGLPNQKVLTTAIIGEATVCPYEWDLANLSGITGSFNAYNSGTEIVVYVDIVYYRSTGTAPQSIQRVCLDFTYIAS